MANKTKNFGKQYTPEEIDTIAHFAGTHTLEAIAKKLHRPRSGLRVKMIELGHSSMHFESGTYSAKGLGEAIGVSHETVRRWILKNGLKAVKRSRSHGTSTKDMSYHILPEDFWSWASENRDMVEFNKIEPLTLLPEPDWVEQERRLQYRRPAKQKIWTAEEDQRLLQLCYQEDLKQREIAERLGRTQSSVEKRLRRLRQQKSANIQR